jgi:hypothetical protein
MKRLINFYKFEKRTEILYFISVAGRKINQSIFFLILLLSSQILFAQVAPVNPPTGGFAIDGGLKANTPVANTGDWFSGSGGTGGSVFDASANAINTATSGRRTDPYNSSDDIFTTGSKFNDYIGNLHWFVNSAPDKNDINNALYHVSRDGSNNQWAFIAGDRLSTNGTSYIDFEFLQGTVSKVAGGSFSATPKRQGKRRWTNRRGYDHFHGIHQRRLKATGLYLSMETERQYLVLSIGQHS